MSEWQPSQDQVRSAVDEIREFLSEEVLAAFAEAAGDSDLWPRASTLTRDFFARRGVSFPDRLEVEFVQDPGRPGGRCLKICRSADPVPPPPDPSGIVICVQVCLPGRPYPYERRGASRRGLGVG